MQKYSISEPWGGGVYISHCKKLNLPRCHGVYARKQPMAHKNDCIGGPAPMINVPSFGICSCPTNPCTTKITLPREAHRNADGSFSGAPPTGVAVGAPCIPVIVQNWNNAHSKMLIGKEGEPALLTNSTLTCLYGGLIDIWRSGQEDGELDQGGAVVENVDEQTNDTDKADGKQADDTSPETPNRTFPPVQNESGSNTINLPEYDGKTTHGVLVLEDGTQIPFSSGNANPDYKNYIPASHVEGKSAIYMRENNINKGTVFHNNTDGTCPYCDKMLPTLLEEGSSLTVIPPENASAPKPSWVDTVKTYIGNDKTPKKPK